MYVMQCMYFTHDLGVESKCIFIPVGKFLSMYYSTIGVGKLAPEKVIGVV